jgi:iron complex transport system substrate-binding protein
MKRLLLTVVLLLATTAGARAASEYVDGTGQKVAHGLDARRIISLAPSVTEMLFFLELNARMVGRSSYCDYPPAALTLPAVGGFTDTSLEKIVILRPDLVVAYQGNSLELIGQLRQLNIQVVALPEAISLDDISTQMEQVAKIVLSRETAQPATGSAASGKLLTWRSRLKSLQLTPIQPLAVFYGLPGEVTFTAAPGSFIDDLITRAGGRNVVPKSRERWPQVGAEFILAAQPDWLLISTPCVGHTELAKASSDIRIQLAQDPVWSKLEAVQQNQIIVINADILMRPGPRILDALEQLQAALGGAK